MKFEFQVLPCCYVVRAAYAAHQIYNVLIEKSPKLRLYISAFSINQQINILRSLVQSSTSNYANVLCFYALC